MSWQDIQHWYIEQDDEPLTQQPRCQCGALLPWQPHKMVERRIPLDWTATYYQQGDGLIITILKEEVEQESVWQCKRCERENTADEAYPR